MLSGCHVSSLPIIQFGLLGVSSLETCGRGADEPTPFSSALKALGLCLSISRGPLSLHVTAD